MNVSCICGARVVIYGKIYCHFNVLCSDMCMTIYHITVQAQKFQMFIDSMNIVCIVSNNINTNTFYLPNFKCRCAIQIMEENKK